MVEGPCRICAEAFYALREHRRDERVVAARRVAGSWQRVEEPGMRNVAALLAPPTPARACVILWAGVGRPAACLGDRLTGVGGNASLHSPF